MSRTCSQAVERNARGFAVEQHGEYPGAKGDGTNAADTEAAFVAQLTTFTDSDGDASATRDATHIYGPYLTRSSSRRTRSSTWRPWRS